MRSAAESATDARLVRWASRLLSIESLWVLLALSIPFAFPASSPIQGDTWWTLKTGELIVSTGRLPTSDSFSFTPRASAFVDAQWVPQLLFYQSYRLLGLPGVALVTAVVVTAIYAVLLSLCWLRAGSIRLAVVGTVLATLLSVRYFLAWAETLGALAFVLSYLLLSGAGPRERAGVAPRTPRSGAAVAGTIPAGLPDEGAGGSPVRRAARLASLAGIEAFWANTHGSFVLGPLLAVLLLSGECTELVIARFAATGDADHDHAAIRGRGSSLTAGLGSLIRAPRVRFLATAFALQVAASLATPYGPRIYDYVSRIGSDPTIHAYISAWRPTTIQDGEGLAFFGSVGLMLAAIGLSAGRLRVGDVLVLAVFAVLGLEAVRNIAWWALAAAPILAERLSLMPPLQRRLRQVEARAAAQPRHPTLSAIAIGLVLGFLVWSLPCTKGTNPFLPRTKLGMVDPDAPRAAAAFLADHALPRRVFSNQPWGGYLEWRLWPRYQIAFDGRIEIHPTDSWLAYRDLTDGLPDWQQQLDRLGADVLLLSRGDQARLIVLVRQSADWRQVYADEQAIIFVRADRLSDNSGAGVGNSTLAPASH